MYNWQALTLGFLTVVMVPLVIIKIKGAFNEYRKILTEEFLSLQRDYDELVTQEGIVYDMQLKQDKKLSEISNLYEITKQMSTSLRFENIFKILAEYLQKTFLFKKARLIVMAEENDTSSSKTVYETAGLQDSTLKAKGIIPKLEISTRPLGDHDKKICGLLEKDIRQLQIVKSRWGESPYAQFLPEDTETYTATPIVIYDNLIGILAIEGLQASDFDKFSILATQFSLEMRRIILYERVEKMAITDGLTKAFARRHIIERLGEEFERSLRHNFNLSFLMVDIDRFKNYNDTYGHLVGDVVLKNIVAILKNNTREVDLVGRFGGEEFCVILPETGKEEARLVAERIREIVHKHKFKAYDELTNVTVSFGIATYPEDAEDMNELIENSDKALYAAKNSGRNKVCVYNNR